MKRAMGITATVMFFSLVMFYAESWSNHVPNCGINYPTMMNFWGYVMLSSAFMLGGMAISEWSHHD